MDLTVRIQRYDPETDSAPHFEDYDLENVNATDRILDLLNRIKWEIDGGLTYRRS